MNTRQLIASGALVLLLSPVALANAPEKSATSATGCKSLENQFDKAAETSHNGQAAKAKLLRTEGAELCTQGKQVEGQRKLEEAIRMLGAVPSRN